MSVRLNPQTIENIALPVIFSLAVFSLIWSKLRGDDSRNPRETWANLGTFVLGRLLYTFVTKGFQFAALTAFARLTPLRISMTGWTLAAAVLLIDFLYYWKHRLEHEVKFLWAEHSVHHSSEEFNLSTALRLPWIAPFFGWIFWIPAVLIGFSAVEVFAAYQLVLLFQYLIHTEKVGRLGGLEWILNTPSNHRVHHGKNARYLDKNYGGIFIIWDLLFGTYQTETEKVVYGTIHPIESKNPFVINFKPWAELFTQMKSVTHWKAKISVLFESPNVLR